MTYRAQISVLAILALIGCGPDRDVTVDELTEASTVAPSSSSLVTLYTWYSPSRDDYFTTSQPAWAGSHGDSRAPDYSFVRVEGQAWRPDAAQPTDTVALHTWWRGSTRDNLMIAGTAYDAWLLAQGFVHVRLEGYAAEQNLAGTVGLHFYYGSEYAVTANPLWSSTGYTFWRTEGYLFKPANWHPRHPKPEIFGYNRDPEIGSRPLLVIVRNDIPSRAGSSNDAAFYRRLVFGPGSQTIPGFFTANSYGKFTFTDAGVVEMWSTDDSGTGILRDSGGAGINYDVFDDNRDGTVTSDELAVVVVTKDNIACGQSPGVACVTPVGSSVNVCLSSVSFVGEFVSFATIAHELMHHLGMWDIYGPGANYNFLAATTAATCFAGNSLNTFQVDPWHRINWGWIEPRVVSLNEPATVETQYIPSAFGGFGYDSKRPTILFDPSRGVETFFMLEARAPDGSYDAQVADSGLAVWQIDLKGLVPDLIQWQADTDPELDGIFGIRLIHGPDSTGATGVRPGVGRFFRQSDGAVPLDWADGTSTGVTLEFDWTDTTRTVGHVQVGDHPVFRARLDTPTLTTRAGETMLLSGVFGLPGARAVYLYNKHVSAELPIVSWSPEGITKVTVPSWIGPDKYTLIVKGATSETESNRISVRVL